MDLQGSLEPEKMDFQAIVQEQAELLIFFIKNREAPSKPENADL